MPLLILNVALKVRVNSESSSLSLTAIEVPASEIYVLSVMISFSRCSRNTGIEKNTKGQSCPLNRGVYSRRTTTTNLTQIHLYKENLPSRIRREYQNFPRAFRQEQQMVPDVWKHQSHGKYLQEGDLWLRKTKQGGLRVPYPGAYKQM